jgi:hypothetical protein
MWVPEIQVFWLIRGGGTGKGDLFNIGCVCNAYYPLCVFNFNDWVYKYPGRLRKKPEPSSIPFLRHFMSSKSSLMKSTPNDDNSREAKESGSRLIIRIVEMF